MLTLLSSQAWSTSGPSTMAPLSPRLVDLEMFAGFGGKRPFNYFTFGAALTEVELDTLTGNWHILRADMVMDVGQSLNPAIDIGQVEGGYVQGALLGLLRVWVLGYRIKAAMGLLRVQD